MKLFNFLILLLLIFTVNISAFAYEENIAVKVNKTIKIELNSNPTTGYQWQLANPINENIIKQISNEYLPPKSNFCGVAGNEVWIFKGLKKGETKIILKYIRPWENAKPTTIKEYNIKVY